MNIRINAVLTGVLLLINLYQFILLPLIFLPSFLSVLLTLIPICLLSNSLWYLIHEAVHRNLHPNPHMNDGLGGLLSILFGSSYHVLRFGHLMHHRFNGSEPDRPDLYDPSRTSRVKASMKYYRGLIIGLYLSEVLIILLFFLPKKLLIKVIERLLSGNDIASRDIREAGIKQLTDDTILSTIRIEGMSVCILLAMSFVLYGGFWYVVMIILAVRGFFISFANNLPHYGTDPSDVKFALNIKMPRLVGLFYLNFNHHRVHHHDPLVPWVRLPETMRKTGDSFDKSILLAAIAQFKGPIPRDSFKVH